MTDEPISDGVSSVGFNQNSNYREEIMYRKETLIVVLSAACAFAQTPANFDKVQANSVTTNHVKVSAPGDFSNKQMDEHIESSVNCDLDKEFSSQQNHNYASDAVAGCVQVPAGARVVNGNAIAGYATSSCDSNSRSVCNAVGGYFAARALANKSAIWGLNPIIRDLPGTAGTSLTGMEMDIGIYGRPGFVQPIGIDFGGDGTLPPNSTIFNIGYAWGKPPSWAPFAVGIQFLTGIVRTALVLGGQDSTNSNSQAIQFAGFDSGGTAHVFQLFADANGNPTFSSGKVRMPAAMTSRIQTGTVSNTDLAGELTFNGANVVTYTLAGGYASHPQCTVEPQFDPGSGNDHWITYPSTDSMAVHFRFAVNGRVSYTCVGRN